MNYRNVSHLPNTRRFINGAAVPDIEAVAVSKLRRSAFPSTLRLALDVVV